MGIVDRHGAWITAATVALRHGRDPLEYLSLEGLEKTVIDLVLSEAEDRRRQDEEVTTKRLEIAVQNGVAKAFGA